MKFMKRVKAMSSKQKSSLAIAGSAIIGMVTGVNLPPEALTALGGAFL